MYLRSNAIAGSNEGVRRDKSGPCAVEEVIAETCNNAFVTSAPTGDFVFSECKIRNPKAVGLEVMNGCAIVCMRSCLIEAERGTHRLGVDVSEQGQLLATETTIQGAEVAFGVKNHSSRLKLM